MKYIKTYELKQYTTDLFDKLTTYLLKFIRETSKNENYIEYISESSDNIKFRVFTVNMRVKDISRSFLSCTN